MDAEAFERSQRKMREAKTEAEQSEAFADALTHVGLCQMSTRSDVTEVKREVGELDVRMDGIEASIEATKKSVATIDDNIQKLQKKVDTLHSKPSFSENKLDWFKENWWQVLFGLYFLKSLGVDLVPFIQAVIGG